MFGYDKRLRRSGLAVINMFFSFSLQLSFGLNDVWSITVIAQDLIDLVIIVEVIVGIFMNLDKAPKIIEYLVIYCEMSSVAEDVFRICDIRKIICRTIFELIF